MRRRAYLEKNKLSEPFPPEMPLSSIRKLLRVVKPYTFQIILVVLAAVFLSFLTGITQLALTPLLNLVLGTNITQAASTPPTFSFDLNKIGPAILSMISSATGLTDRWQLLAVTSIAYLALILIGQAAGFGARVWITRLRFSMVADVEHLVFSHILRLPLSFLRKYQAGWLFSRMDLDVRSAGSTLSEVVIDGLSSLLVSLFYAALLVRTSLSLALFAALAGVIQLALTRFLSTYTKRLTRRVLETSARLQAFGLERLLAVREIKALAAEAYEATVFRNFINQWKRVNTNQFIYKKVESPLRMSVNRTVIVAVMLFGAWQLVHGQLSTTAFLLFMFFAQQLITPLSSLSEMLLSLVEIRSTLDGVGYILSQDDEREGTGSRLVEGLHDHIVLKNVSFAYRDLPVLKNINLTIQRGEMVALVGKSGAGKSTLADLLMRFFIPTEGVIELDGIPAQEFDLAAYRRLFGVVSQDGLLFNETVYQNIAYARPELSQEDVERAARIANAENFILNDLDQGYDTLLGERGVRISGGQRQRVAIARAVVHRPQILVLDEATSALDSESERLVQEAISHVVKGHTSIVIAHRLSTILMADKIVVLRDGEIVEMGTHKELLALNGEYSYLYNLQFNDGVVTPMPQPERTATV